MNASDWIIGEATPNQQRAFVLAGSDVDHKEQGAVKGL